MLKPEQTLELLEETIAIMFCTELIFFDLQNTTNAKHWVMQGPSCETSFCMSVFKVSFTICFHDFRGTRLLESLKPILNWSS